MCYTPWQQTPPSTTRYESCTWISCSFTDAPSSHNHLTLGQNLWLTRESWNWFSGGDCWLTESNTTMFFCEERFQDNGQFGLECYSLKRPGQPERQQSQFSQENLFSQIYFSYILSVLYWHYGKSTLWRNGGAETKVINNSFGLELNFPPKISSETSIFMLICNRTLLKEAIVHAIGKY